MCLFLTDLSASASSLLSSQTLCEPLSGVLRMRHHLSFLLSSKEMYLSSFLCLNRISFRRDLPYSPWPRRGVPPPFLKCLVSRIPLRCVLPGVSVFRYRLICLRAA